jgi:hypothetical protein
MSQRTDPAAARGDERPGLGPTFGAMLQEFNLAARLLNLDPGIWRILTHPKRQIVVSCPGADGQRRDRSVHRLSESSTTSRSVRPRAASDITPQ